MVCEDTSISFIQKKNILEEIFSCRKSEEFISISFLRLHFFLYKECTDYNRFICLRHFS